MLVSISSSSITPFRSCTYPQSTKVSVFASRQMDSDMIQLMNMALRIYGLLLLIGLVGAYLITQV